MYHRRVWETVGGYTHDTTVGDAWQTRNGRGRHGDLPEETQMEPENHMQTTPTWNLTLPDNLYIYT